MNIFNKLHFTDKHRWINYAAAFGLTVVVAFGWLLVSAFLPQAPINKHVRESASIMIEEGTYPVIADRTDGSVLDNFTDAIILMQSKSLNRSGLRSSLTNPNYNTSDNPVESLYNYAHDPDPQVSSYYYRYWMGFRTIIRFVLVFMNYYEFKRYLAFVFFLLFALVLCNISSTTNSKIAMAFAVSIILVRPYVICNSIQYSTCFFIAFIAMLLVPWIHKHPKFEKLFFMEIGMITMYFDFYTTPILTFGLPMVYLYILRVVHNQNTSAKSILHNGFVWLAAYVLMWIAKLSLVSLLTPLNGFQNSILLPLYNSNLAYLSEVNIFEMILRAYEKVFSTIAPTELDQTVVNAVLLVALIYILILKLKKRTSAVDFKQYLSIFVITLFPLVWYAASNRALQNHFYFQNRSLAVIFWVVGIYFLLVFREKGKKT